MEVYAVTREFAEWGKGFYNRLPATVRNGLRAAGVCHYLVVVRQPEDGRLWMFDFGPGPLGATEENIRIVRGFWFPRER